MKKKNAREFYAGVLESYFRKELGEEYDKMLLVDDLIPEGDKTEPNQTEDQIKRRKEATDNAQNEDSHSLGEGSIFL